MRFRSFTIFGILLGSMLGHSSFAFSARKKTGDLPAKLRIVLGVRLNDDNYASSIRKLGPAEIWHTGDAGSSAYHWCYSYGNKTDPTYVIFESDAEMDGEEHEISRIRLVSTAPVADNFKRRCSQIESVDVVSETWRLGMKRIDLEHLIGKAQEVASDSFSYSWSTTEPVLPSDPIYIFWNGRRKECFHGIAPFLNVYASVSAKFNAGGAFEIELLRGDNAIC